MASFSTRRFDFGHDGGWPLDKIPDDALAGMLRVPVDQTAARRAELARQHRDPAWIAAALDALPAATLALLQLLAEAGGIALDRDLAAEAQIRYGIARERYQQAMLPALHAALAVPLTAQSAEGTSSALALIQPAAALVRPAVADLDVAPRAAAAFVARDSSLGDARSFLALCIAARHVDLKLTMDGCVNRGSVKRLAKQVGVDDGAANSMLTAALALRLLIRSEDLARPDLGALTAAAAGEYAASSGLPALQTLLADGPVERASAQRWLERSGLADTAALVGYGALPYLPGFAEGTVDGTPAVSCRALEGSASGHVTPSFEIVLPPESRLLDIVQVGACCEWVRLDRAIVARITKPAITRALAAGASGEQIVGWLAAASRHALPQNVESAVRDWTGAATPATIATGHVVMVDPAADGRAHAALGKLDPRKLAPGVFVIASTVQVRDISRALQQAGILVPTTGSAPQAQAKAKPARPTAPVAPARSDARLRAKVAAWRRGEPFEGVLDNYLDQDVAPPVPAKPTQLPAAVHEQLAAWAARHGFADGELSELINVVDRDNQVRSIMDLLTGVPPGDLEAVLADARDLRSLVSGLARLLVRPGGGPQPPSRSPVPPSGPQRPRAAPPLLWQRVDLRSRLEAAAKRAEWLMIDAGGKRRCVEVDRVMRRGSAWMVLGEDLEAEVAVALPLDQIKAIAALPDDFDPAQGLDLEDDEDEDDDVVEPGHRPWRPRPGQAAPAGHAPCPCGSGVRYRNCCRPVAEA